MKEILLTRHAESEFNALDRINSDPRISCPLTKWGKEQARTLRQLLAEDPIDLCATSEHERAIATADIALEGREIPRLVLPDLNDPNAGELEGQPASRYRARLEREGPYARNPGGESQIDAVGRYVRAFRQLSELPEQRILVVGHGTPLAWLREGRRIAHEPDGGTPRVDFGNPGVEMAGRPDRLDRRELRLALGALERFLSRKDRSRMVAGRSLTLTAEPLTAPPVQRLLAESEGQAKDVYPDTWDPNRGPTVEPTEFEPPGGRFVVAYVSGEAVACGGFRPLSEEVAEVKRLFVSAAARRRGVGSHVLGHLERQARDAGYRIVRLDTGSRQPAALALFRSAGYREIPDYNGNELAAHWFEKRL